MNKTSLVAALALAGVATLWSTSAAQPQERAESQLGTVHFPTSCNEVAQRRFDRAMRYQHSFWYRASQEIFQEALKADADCAIAHWGIALSLLYNPHAPPPPENLPLGFAALQKAKAMGAKSERERDYIDALLVFYYRPRQARSPHPRAELSQGGGSVGAQVRGRRRSADRLRDHPQRRRLARRQDLRQPAQGRGDPGADLPAPAAASRRRPLPDPPL